MSPGPPRIGILGIGTAQAPYASRQADLLDALAPALERGSTRERLATRLFLDAAIEERRFCIPDFSHPERAVLYDGTALTHRRRMQVYQREAPRLAAAACERALKSARIAPDRVTHLVVVTCTGIFTPGPDVELASRLCLRPEVERTLVGFMGCSGCFHGLRVGRRAAAESSDARVLLASVELCSLHRRNEAGIGNLVVQSLFGDGAAAVVLGSIAEGREHLAELGAACTRLEPGTRSALRWEMDDDGFSVHLSRSLPSLVGGAVAHFVEPLLADGDERRPGAWVVHPGGAGILRTVARALDLGPGELASAWSVLKRLGNTSSTAILYVLEEALALLSEGDAGLMLGFGPGLTFEALRFCRGSQRV